MKRVILEIFNDDIKLFRLFLLLTGVLIPLSGYLNELAIPGQDRFFALRAVTGLVLLSILGGSYLFPIVKENFLDIIYISIYITTTYACYVTYTSGFNVFYTVGFFTSCISVTMLIRNKDHLLWFVSYILFLITFCAFDFWGINALQAYIMISYFVASGIVGYTILNTGITYKEELSARKFAELKLGEYEERWTSLVRNTPDIITIINREGIILYHNKLLDNEKEAVGMSISNFINEKDEFRLRQYIETVYNEKKALKFDIQAYGDGDKEKGKSEWYSCRMIPVNDENLSISSITVISTNITEKMLVEEKIRKSEEKYRDLVENSLDLICIHDLKGKILTVNPAFVNLLGRTTSAYIGSNIKDFLIQGYENEFDKYLDQIKNNKKAVGYMKVLSDNGDKKILEYSNTLKTENVDQPIVRSRARDITQMINAERALRLSEEKFRNIFNSIPDVLYRTELDGTVIMTSPSVEKIMGYKPEQLIGTNIISLYKDPSLRADFIKKLDEYGFVTNFENRVIKSNGQIIYTSSNCYYIYDKNNNPVAIEGLVRDITTNKEVEKRLIEAKTLAVEAAKTKTEFIANVSHELRTPLNGILGITYLLKKSNLSRVQMDRVETIEQSTIVLSGIINDLLELSKIDAKKIKIKPVPFNIVKVLDKLLKIFSAEALNKNIELAYQVEANVPKNIIADQLRINQVLNDLVSNAIKFTEKGSVVIRVKLADEKSKVNKKCRMRFEIVDTGIGIAQQNFNKLFKRFSQVERTHNKKRGGTGLGLAICKDLVSLMNGEIGVESNVGEGSNFWFELDVKVAAKNDKKNQVAVKKLKRSDNKDYKDTPNINILLIEDNYINQKVVANVLRDYGFSVEVAINGREGIDKLYKNEYDLVFLDYQMPDLTGEDILKELRQKDNMIQRQPIVILSANILEENKEKLLSLGAVDYLTKPLDYLSLYAYVLEKVSLYKNNKKQMMMMEEQIFDETIFDYIESLSDVNVNLILEEYLNNTNIILEQIYNYLEENDYESIRKKLHVLKGVSATIGISGFSKHIQGIIEKIDGKDINGLDHYIAELNKQYVAVERHFNKKINTKHKEEI